MLTLVLLVDSLQAMFFPPLHCSLYWFDRRKIYYMLSKLVCVCVCVMPGMGERTRLSHYGNKNCTGPEDMLHGTRAVHCENDESGQQRATVAATAPSKCCFNENQMTWMNPVRYSGCSYASAFLCVRHALCYTLFSRQYCPFIVKCMHSHRTRRQNGRQP